MQPRGLTMGEAERSVWNRFDIWSYLAAWAHWAGSTSPGFEHLACDWSLIKWQMISDFLKPLKYTPQHPTPPMNSDYFGFRDLFLSFSPFTDLLLVFTFRWAPGVFI